VIVRRCLFREMTARITFNSGYALIENNIFTYNGDYQAKLASLQATPNQTGQNSVELDGEYVVLPNNILNHNETQPYTGNGTILQASGASTGSSMTALVDGTQNWPVNGWAGFILAIVKGRGAGQARRVVSDTATTLSLVRAWDLIPESGSQYAVTKFAIESPLIRVNQITNKFRGIWMYQGGRDIAIVGNQQNNSHGIWLRADNRPSIGQYRMVHDALIADNIIRGTNDTRMAHITLSQFHNQTDTSGTGAFGVEIRRITVVANLPNRLDSTAASLRDGYSAIVNYPTDGQAGSPDTAVAGIVGTIFDGNRAENTDAAFRTVRGTAQTVIAKSVIVSAPRLVASEAEKYVV
jgi:hypothetical protein